MAWQTTTKLFEQTFSPKYIGYYPDNSRPSGLVVNDDTELQAAVTAGIESTLIMAAGSYSSASVLNGVSRAGNPLTITSQYFIGSPARVVDVGWSVENSDNITLDGVTFENTNAAATPYRALYDTNGNGCHDLAITNCAFIGVEPPDLNDPNIDPNYADGLISGPRLSSFDTYNITLQNNRFENVYTWFDVRPNGNLLCTDNTVNNWYFDGIRMTGQPEEGYVEGVRRVEQNYMLNSIGKYNEETPSSPHPDNTQMFNSGSGSNNTNPKITNLIFYRNVFNPGFYRADNVQTGLSQSKMENVGWLQNLGALKLSSHGVSLENGGNGVMIENNSLVDCEKTSSPWIRIFKSDGQILSRGNYFPAGYNIGTGGNANLTGYELDDENNIDSLPSGYDGEFNNVSGLSGADGALTMFTPLSDTGVGAVTSAGALRNFPHSPMQSAAPDVTAGTEQFTLDSIKQPTLYSSDYASLGGDSYTRFDVRWSPAGAYTWTEQNNVNDSDIISAVTAGSTDIQTRCVNITGDGLWSKTETVSIS